MSIGEQLRQQTRIEQALDRYSKEELVSMLANLMKTYVIDGTAPLKPEVGKVHIPVHLRDLSFPVLIETLQFHLDLPDLQKFNVVDGQVYVKLGEREFALDGPAPAPQRPAPSAPPPTPRATARPAASPTPEAPPTPAPPVAPPPGPPKPKAPPAAPKAADDRFRMLELD